MGMFNNHGEGHVEDQGLNGMIILKWIWTLYLKELCIKIRTGKEPELLKKRGEGCFTCSRLGF